MFLIFGINYFSVAKTRIHFFTIINYFKILTLCCWQKKKQ